MNKPILGLLLLISSQNYAQYRSLLSASEHGRSISSVFSSNRLAGNLSAAYSGGQVMNFQNPASYADATLTNIEVGTYAENGSYEMMDSAKSSGGIGLTHFSLLLPLSPGRSGLGLGFYRNSATDYSYKSSSQDALFGTIDRRLLGNGNSYSAFVGTGIRFSRLKVGANLMANFGNVNYQSDIIFVDSMRLPRIREINSLSEFGFSYHLGLQYDFVLSPDKEIIVGAYYRNTFYRNGSNQLLIQNIYNAGLTSEARIKAADTTYDVTMPTSSQFGIGISYIVNKSILVGAEMNFTNLSAYKNILDTTYLGNAYSLNLGMEYKPYMNRNTNTRKFLNKLTYRLGANMGKNEYSLSGINDFKVMGGVTIPVLSRSIGYITTGIEFQQRSNNGVRNISESILSLRLILTFADKWFVRSKFD